MCSRGGMTDCVKCMSVCVRKRERECLVCMLNDHSALLVCALITLQIREGKLNCSVPLAVMTAGK